MGWPRVPYVHARPCATRPRPPPRPHHAETCERCCRPSSAAESCRAAGSARGSRCAADRGSRSSPPACRSCAGVRRVGQAGSSAPAAPIPHHVDRSDTRPPRAGKSYGAPLSTSLFAITASPIASEPCHSARRPRTFGSCSQHRVHYYELIAEWTEQLRIVKKTNIR